MRIMATLWNTQQSKQIEKVQNPEHVSIGNSRKITIMTAKKLVKSVNKAEISFPGCWKEQLLFCEIKQMRIMATLWNTQQSKQIEKLQNPEHVSIGNSRKITIMTAKNL